MATRVDLHKDLIKTLLEQGIGLRQRQIKAASNPIIKQALDEELSHINRAMLALETIPENKTPNR